MSSGPPSRLIPAAGGIANGIVGLLSLLAARWLRGSAAPLRYFLILKTAFNLLFAAGCLVYSGLTAFGDWAAVISGLDPAWAWRALLVGAGGIAYYLSLRAIAVQIAPFCGADAPGALARPRLLTLLLFVAALFVAAAGGCFNPRGWTNLFTSALPTAAGAFGLTQLDHFPEARSNAVASVEAQPIERNLRWIAVAVVLALVFVGVLGPGIRFGSNK